VNLRIEGKDSTIYEGKVFTGPQVVTTPSGGSHSCDGTNNGANPAPFANGVSALVDSARLCSFPLDGSFSSQFDDFFITKIGDSDSNDGSNRYW
jgi:hypothetical protein